ncbi:protein EMSY-LIKE 3-like [Impatiens glandulifera]|uniref:protein EMSY-LIKE 3-like n=1 Tax=Impatiens glandulifera TaxID=253017 RepID=UPI001FB07AAC|nr:protein EMSY-LIKE 3-like [Impatiens glandulifera]
MDYNDSSGTDDDLPPQRRNRFPQGGRTIGNSISGIQGSARYPQMHSEMESQIHIIEQEAYISILRAFKAQSDAITWEKESLITELRKELRVSDEEHRHLLSKVNGDDTIGRIREWRKTGGVRSSAQQQPVHDPVPSPTVSASHKKQKTSQSVVVASMPLDAPIPTFRKSMPPSLALKQGPGSTPRGKKSKSIPEDIMWDVENRGIISNQSGGTAPGHGSKKSSYVGTTKGPTKKKQFFSSGNPEKSSLTDIELLHTDTLIKQVEKVFSASQPNPADIEKARKALKEHEEALINAIARLEDASDGESGQREKKICGLNEETDEGRGNEEGSDGNHQATKAGIVGTGNGHDNH